MEKKIFFGLPLKSILLHFNFIRVWLEFYTYKLSTSYATVFHQFDYKGDLPTFVINFALDRQMMQLANIKVVLEKCLLSPGFSDSGISF